MLFATTIGCGSGGRLKGACCVNFLFIVVVVIAIVINLVIKPWILIIKAASAVMYIYKKNNKNKNHA